MAPEAPNEATDKELLITVGIKIEKNDAITAEFKYATKKLEAPTMPHNVVPND